MRGQREPSSHNHLKVLLALLGFFLKSPIALAECYVGPNFSAVNLDTLIVDILAKAVSPLIQKNGVKDFF